MMIRVYSDFLVREVGDGYMRVLQDDGKLLETYLGYKKSVNYYDGQTFVITKSQYSWGGVKLWINGKTYLG